MIKKLLCIFYFILFSQRLVNDPIQVVFNREKIKEDDASFLKIIVHKFLLPDCYQPEDPNKPYEHPYKQLLFWAVLSKK